MVDLASVTVHFRARCSATWACPGSMATSYCGVFAACSLAGAALLAIALTAYAREEDRA